jgi:predicted dehydrogenase
MSHSVLIIGCGSIGERHLRCFLHTGRARVTGCDTNAALLTRIAATYQVPTATDWEQVLAQGGIDCAVICAPAPAHVPIAIKLLQAGVHVLIEKPLSHSLQDVDTLVDTRDRSGRQVSVAYVFHVFPVLRAAREVLQTGALGPILQATVTSGQPFHLLRPAYAQTYYRDHRMGGGAIQDALTHSVNWVESVIGPADSVLCDASHQFLPGVEVEDTVQVSARHGATLASYTLNQFQTPNETTLQFHAAAGSVKIELHRQRWGVCRAGDKDWTWHDVPPLERDDLFTAQANAFLDQVEGRPSTLCTLEAAAHTLRFNLAALAAASSGTRIACRPFHA